MVQKLIEGCGNLRRTTVFQHTTLLSSLRHDSYYQPFQKNPKTQTPNSK